MCNKTESVLPFFLFVQRELRILKLRLILCGSFFFFLTWEAEKDIMCFMLKVIVGRVTSGSCIQMLKHMQIKGRRTYARK